MTTYSDIPTNLDFHPGTKDIARLTDEVAIKTAIRNILKTSFYERYDALFGSNLNKLLFEQLDRRTITSVEQIIRTALESYEPRVRVDEVIVTGLTDELTLGITLQYTILNTASPQKLVLTIERVR